MVPVPNSPPAGDDWMQLAFAIDLQLRLDTAGQLTFDDLMTYLSRQYAGRPLTTASFHQAILLATGQSYGDLFFRYALTDELPTPLYERGSADLYRP